MDQITEGEASDRVDTTEGMTELEMLRECLNEQTRVAQINAEAIVQLSAAMRGLAPAPVVVPTEDQIRNSKFEKLYMLWLKQSKFK